MRNEGMDLRAASAKRRRVLMRRFDGSPAGGSTQRRRQGSRRPLAYPAFVRRRRASRRRLEEARLVQAQKKPSLYERLGGAYKIAILIDDFIDRIMADPRLEANPRVKAKRAHLEARLQVYRDGDDVLGDRWTANVHRPFDGRLSPQSEDHRRRVALVHGRFRGSLDACKVRKPEQRELIRMLERSKGDRRGRQYRAAADASVWPARSHSSRSARSALPMSSQSSELKFAARSTEAGLRTSAHRR